MSYSSLVDTNATRFGATEEMRLAISFRHVKRIQLNGFFYFQHLFVDDGINPLL